MLMCNMRLQTLRQVDLNLNFGLAAPVDILQTGGTTKRSFMKSSAAVRRQQGAGWARLPQMRNPNQKSLRSQYHCLTHFTVPILVATLPQNSA
jgi:hypothetical protein